MTRFFHLVEDLLAFIALSGLVGINIDPNILIKKNSILGNFFGVLRV